jgi:hypothetical protein
LVVCASSTWAVEESEQDAPESAPAADPVPPGQFLIHEVLWDDLADEPGQHMDRARVAFIELDARQAAAELRKAATYLKITAGNAAAATKRALLRSADELDELAHRVEAGTVRTVGELDRAFARASHALSHHHCVIAERSWAARQTTRAGKQLRAAADNLERAAMRTGKALQTATETAVKDARIVSGKLVEGTGFVFDEIGKGFAAFGKLVENTGKSIEPHPIPPPTALQKE